MSRQEVIDLYRQVKADRERFQELLNGPVAFDAEELEAAPDPAFSAALVPDGEQAERQWDELYEHISSLGIRMAESVLYPPLHAFMTHLERTDSATDCPEHQRFLRAYDCFGRSRWMRDYAQARPLYEELMGILFGQAAAPR